MTAFDPQFFVKFKFGPGEIKRYLDNAFRDLEIAKKDPFAEVRFSYSYQSLIKGGIALIAHTGKVKVRSVPGHHVKILTKMSEILKEPDILTLGNAMRMKRNADLYSGGKPVAEKESKEYLHFVEKVLANVRKILN